MMAAVLRLLWRLTGGRPMILTHRCVFLDIVTGHEVHRYVDRLGRSWLAEHPMAGFRLRVQKPADQAAVARWEAPE